MALEQVAQAHYRRQALTTRRIVGTVLRLWQAAGPSGFRDELTRVDEVRGGPVDPRSRERAEALFLHLVNT